MASSSLHLILQPTSHGDLSYRSSAVVLDLGVVGVGSEVDEPVKHGAVAMCHDHLLVVL